MRLRNIAGSREVIAESKFTVKEPEKVKGLWKNKLITELFLTNKAGYCLSCSQLHFFCNGCGAGF